MICLAQQAAAMHKTLTNLIHKQPSSVGFSSLCMDKVKELHFPAYCFNHLFLLICPIPNSKQTLLHLSKNQTVTTCNKAQFAIKGSVLNTKEELVG